MKTTEWFPVSIKPAAPGWYEARFDDGSGFDKFWFDGDVWRYEPDMDESLFGNLGEGWESDHWRHLRSPQHDD